MLDCDTMTLYHSNRLYSQKTTNIVYMKNILLSMNVLLQYILSTMIVTLKYYCIIFLIYVRKNIYVVVN